jgi:Ca2+-binding EF-hand superfamily protein
VRRFERYSIDLQTLFLPGPPVVRQHKKMQLLKWIVAVAFVLVVVAQAQQQQDYNEYTDYAARAAQGKKKGGGGGGLVTTVVSGLVGNFVGGWMKKRSLAKKQAKEKKDLLKYIQQIDDTYKTREAQWQREYQKLYKAYEALESAELERDYEEFKAPDTDGDDKVTREEYAIYVRKYLASFPELSEKDFPNFDEFDLDSDGTVSFAEWQRYLKQQKLKEAQKTQEEKGDGAYSQLLQQLYQKAHDDGSWSNSARDTKSVGVGGRR